MGWSRRLATTLLLISTLLWAPLSLAAPTDAEKETARSLMDDGDRLRAANDLPSALQRYQAAHQIMNVPTTGIEVARTYAALGKLVEARRSAIEVANLPVQEAEPAVMAEARQAAGVLATELAQRIPAATIQVWPHEAQTNVFIDGVKLPEAAKGLPYKTNPGSHVVQVTAAGYQTAEQQFTLEEGATTTVSVNLVADAAAAPAVAPAPAASPEPAGTTPVEPTAPEAPAPDMTRAYVAFGIAGAGVLAGTITGLISLDKVASAKDRCNGNVCPPQAEDDIDSSKSMATFSNIGFGIAIAAGAWGLYEVLSQPASPSAPAARRRTATTPEVALTLLPGEAAASLRGSF